jgi:hypothetical protein
VIVHHARMTPPGVIPVGMSTQRTCNSLGGLTASRRTNVIPVIVCGESAWQLSNGLVRRSSGAEIRDRFAGDLPLCVARLIGFSDRTL